MTTAEIVANDFSIVGGTFELSLIAILYNPHPASINAVDPETDIIVIMKFLLYLIRFLNVDLYLNFNLFQMKPMRSNSIFFTSSWGFIFQ